MHPTYKALAELGRAIKTNLMDTLSAYTLLSKRRLETLSFLIVGILSARTVNLIHVASERHGAVQIASTYRRLQRFFQYVFLPEDWSAILIVRLLSLGKEWTLCLDRTNWKIGGKDVNILMLAIVTRRHRVPVMWTLLGRAGNSNTRERIDLLNRYCAVFGVRTIKVLLADREFIGFEWFLFLQHNKVPFAIRVRSNQIIEAESGTRVSLEKLLRTCWGNRAFKVGFPPQGSEFPVWLSRAAKRVKGGALDCCGKQRCPPGSFDLQEKVGYRMPLLRCQNTRAQSRGHTAHQRQKTEFAPVNCCPSNGLGIPAFIQCPWLSINLAQKHGYPAKSRFRIGFDHLRNLLRNNPDKAAKIWKNAKPKLTKINRVV